MTLIQKYNSLSREKQIELKAFWMQKTGLSNSTFYKRFRKPTSQDVDICEEFCRDADL